MPFYYILYFPQKFLDSCIYRAKHEDEVLARVAGSSNRIALFAMLDAMTMGNAALFQNRNWIQKPRKP